MKRKHDVAVLTTMFNLEWSVAYDFFNSLSNQDYKAFDIFAVNDGFVNLAKIREVFPDLTIREIPPTNSIAKNREKLIKNALKQYRKAVFCDFDDYFSSNRVSLSISYLEENDIVFNDVSLFVDDKIFQNKRFSNDLSDGTFISSNDIAEKNYLGFSNVAINLETIKDLEFTFSSSLIAVDWYFFTITLLQGKLAVFTDKMITYYRQHSNNIADIDKVDYSQLINELNVKKIHYAEMIKVDTRFVEYQCAIEDFHKNFIQIKDINIMKHLVKMKASEAWWSLIQTKVGKKHDY